MPSRCREGARNPDNVGRPGSTPCSWAPLGATKPKVPADVVANPKDPVPTGLGGTPCMTSTSGATVSEKGLEPPRPKRALGPQPRISVVFAWYSRGLKVPSRPSVTLPATGAAMLTTPEVPARVPRESQPTVVRLGCVPVPSDQLTGRLCNDRPDTTKGLDQSGRSGSGCSSDDITSHRRSVQPPPAGSPPPPPPPMTSPCSLLHVASTTPPIQATIGVRQLRASQYGVRGAG